MSRRLTAVPAVVLAVVLAVVAGWSATAVAAGTVYPISSWDTALAKVIHADNTQSVTLPDGDVLWAFADTTQVNGVSTVGPYGYPHNAFVLQTAGTLTFRAVPGAYGYGWQQVPNWSDQTYFWASTPIVDNGTLYLLGERVKGAAPFTVVGYYIAAFNASTLAFQSIVAAPGGTTKWGGVARGAGGWWITGTRNVCGAGQSTNCSTGDLAYVPFGSLGNAAAWTVYRNVVPAAANLGTVLALKQTAAGWDIFTKMGDLYGSTSVERLTSTKVTGPWTVNGSWSAPSPAGTVTYDVAVHPEQAANSGSVLLSYNVNGVEADYHALFEYLPL